MSLRDRLPESVIRRMTPIVEHALYQDVLSDSEGRPARIAWFKKPSVALNKALFERGVAPPWVWTESECARFWEQMSTDDDANGAEIYAAKPLDVVRFLDGFWSPEVDSSQSVLEIGCNVGANLEGLRRLGFRQLAGIEISPKAIATMQDVFPELTSVVDIHQGPAESVLAAMPTASKDAVFSMAVLLHIHPKSHRVMAEMARVARHHICVLEAEDVTCGYVFARDYRRVFETLGCKELRTVLVTRDSFPNALPNYVGYRARLFSVPKR